MTDEHENAFRAFVGGWQLVSCTARQSDGSEYRRFGDEPLGQIMYSSDGHMSAQLMQIPGPGTGDEPQDYVGYYATFTVDPASHVVTHHVIGASVPNMVGTALPRRYRFEGNRLHLEAAGDGTVIEIIWERRDSGSGLPNQVR